MPQIVDTNGPLKFPDLNYLTLDNWKRGVITLIDKSRLPKDALEEANNIFLVEDGQPQPRPGVDWFGIAPSTAQIDGFDYFDFNGVIHLVAVAGGMVYRSTDDGKTWTACTGATLTARVTTYLNQNGGFMYITNGTDAMTRYDGSTTLQVYTSLATPAAATIARTGLAASNFTYYYKISAVNQIGFSASSVKVSQAVSLTRESWDATTNYLTLTLPAFQATQTRYDIYISEDDLSYFYLDSTTSTTYKDDGTSLVVPSTTAPLSDTTTGPRVEELVNVGERMYGIRDHVNRYRISFTGSGNFAGAFSNAYDGGYLDWQPGGKFIPTQVADYRDGKGTPLATIWCNSADGQGCILQMSLDTLTVGDISITVPSAYKLPGSRGTSAPSSVVNVLNDYMFYNSQAFYNLGSRAQFLNLLSTDESSANIRPTVRQISTAGEAKITATYFYAKVYFSVAYFGATENNYTIVYDTELKAWLPFAFTLGFKKFLHYTSTETDGSKRQRLLAIKPGDTRLSEISKDIQGDYGVAFTSSLLTGLYPVGKDRFEFMFVEEGDVEFSRPTSEIEVALIGLERSKGFDTQNTLVINDDVSTAGWSTFAWSTKKWTDTTTFPNLFDQSSKKHYFLVQREINAYQWRIVTSSLNSDYLLRTLQLSGTLTEAGKPRSWRIAAS